MSQLPISTQITDYLLNNPQNTVNEIADGIERTKKVVDNEIRKNEGKLYYGSSEKYNRRWSLIEENENDTQQQWWEKD